MLVGLEKYVHTWHTVGTQLAAMTLINFHVGGAEVESES